MLDLLGVPPKDVISFFNKALEIDPTNTDAYLHKGFLHNRIRKHEEAITYFDKVLEIEPNNVRALYSKGVVLHFLKKPEEIILLSP